jgi:hypothetical protein
MRASKGLKTRIPFRRKNTMKAKLAAVFIVACLTGCARDFTEVKSSQLNQAFTINSSPTFLGYDYIGSDASHHYFVAKWKYQADKRFKVSSSDLAMSKLMPLGQGTVEIHPCKPTDLDWEELGQLGGRTLFRRK